jgi:hypothetical protein
MILYVNIQVLPHKMSGHYETLLRIQVFIRLQVSSPHEIFRVTMLILIPLKHSTSFPSLTVHL